jgi:glycosyltransferase involved in cell wall biosynthesis
MAGDGPARAGLERSAPGNVTFTGELGDDELIPLMQRCAALVFPSRDDFGLLPVEAMACGRPVLAFAGGGALETVAAGVTGEFFSAQSADAIVAAVEAFDPGAYDSVAIRERALGYGLDRFREAMSAEVAATAAGERL